MGWRRTRSTEPARRARRPPTRAWLAAALLAWPAVALGHERWIPHQPRFPVDHAYFQSMSGEVLVLSLGAAVAIFGVVLLWYLSAPDLVERLTPVTASAQAREERRNFVSRGIRLLARLALDGPVQGRFMTGGLTVAAFLFSKIPAFVLALGAYQGWLVMPSYPLEGDLGDALRIVEIVLALWVLTGLLKRVLGVVFFLVYGYLWFEYGVVAIDAIPVLASAFFYLLSDKDKGPVNGRQLFGMRLSLGVGFFLLGLINKILLHDLFIGVGDQHPDILIGPQEAFPGLTRETWCFATALGEMVFGLLLLMGVFNRITTVLLALIFTNFVFVFGWAEIVHVYPILGFVLLFFRGQLGTALDGLVFKTNLTLFRWMRSSSYRFVHALAVMLVGGWAGAALMFAPLFVITEIAPDAFGIGVPPNYKKPPPVPPAAEWGKIPTPAGSTRVPHGDHNPRHGGVVTMSGDHHVEIVVRRDGGVQLWLTDAVRQPIAPAEGRGSVRIDRAQPGSPVPVRRVVVLGPDSTGALAGQGPPAATPADYTYDLVIRGIAASQTLRVPAGGTDPLVKGGLPVTAPH